jgi:hypothetical protein
MGSVIGPPRGRLDFLDTFQGIPIAILTLDRCVAMAENTIQQDKTHEPWPCHARSNMKLFPERRRPLVRKSKQGGTVHTFSV